MHPVYDPVGAAWTRREVLATLLGAVSLASTAQAAAPRTKVQDVLEQPALLSPLALRATMLSVVRAGSRVVAVGERGIVLYSDDHGQHWKQAVVPISATLTQAAFLDAQRGWATGHSGMVLGTVDGGTTWQPLLDGRRAVALQLEAAQAGGDAKRIAAAEQLQAEGADKPFLALQVQGENTVRVVGAYGLAFESHDGGRQWRSLMEVIDNPRGRHHYAIASLGESVVLAGEQGQILLSEPGKGRYANLGQQGPGTFFGLLATPKLALAYGLRGALYRSTDGGSAWEKVPMPPASLSQGLVMSDGGLLLINEVGIRLRSDDGARSFIALPGAPGAPISGAVQAADGGLILAGVGGLTRIAADQLKTKETRS